MISQPSITVVIAAYEAAETIGRAVRSALAQREVGEVVVIDDDSKDRTADTAFAAGGGDPRLTVLRQDRNGGPSRARNRAIAESSLPFIAILDADDAFVPGRFDKLMRAEAEWDFCADNILFVERDSEFDDLAPIAGDPSASCTIDLSTFVRGNISRRDQLRGELGFLKPVFRRSFVVDNGVSYAVHCRLGEDFLFYSEALARGARYRLYRHCGYIALLRGHSLSGSHRTEDLQALASQCRQLLDQLPLSPAERRIMQTHWRSIQDKIHHREVLEARSRHGLLAGLTAMLTRPTAARDILRDRINPVLNQPHDRRELISDEEFALLCQ
jgi:succinoglycan biosynthesis protein ExoU